MYGTSERSLYDLERTNCIHNSKMYFSGNLWEQIGYFFSCSSTILFTTKQCFKRAKKKNVDIIVNVNCAWSVKLRANIIILWFARSWRRECPGHARRFVVAVGNVIASVVIKSVVCYRGQFFRTCVRYLTHYKFHSHMSLGGMANDKKIQFSSSIYNIS